MPNLHRRIIRTNRYSNRRNIATNTNHMKHRRRILTSLLPRLLSMQIQLVIPLIHTSLTKSALHHHHRTTQNSIALIQTQMRNTATLSQHVVSSPIQTVRQRNSAGTSRQSHTRMSTPSHLSGVTTRLRRRHLLL